MRREKKDLLSSTSNRSIIREQISFCWSRGETCLWMGMRTHRLIVEQAHDQVILGSGLWLGASDPNVNLMQLLQRTGST